MKYQWFPPSGRKDKGIRKFEFATKTQFPWDLLTKKTPKLPNIIFKILTTKHKNVRGKVDYLNNKKHKDILNEKLQFKSQWESTFYLKLWVKGFKYT